MAGFIDALLNESKAHPEHPIQLTRVDRPFYCYGCEEPGVGMCYRCKESGGSCSKIFHEECGRADEITSHPFCKGCFFTFFRPNKGGSSAQGNTTFYRICDACCTEVKGFYYVCRNHEKPHGHFIHPSCIKLQNTIRVDKFEMKLKGSVPEKCGLCEHKRAFDGMKGWSYVSTCGSQCLHIKCVKKIFLDDWKKAMFGGSSSSYLSIASSSSSTSITPAAERLMITDGNTSNSGQEQAIVVLQRKTSFSIHEYTAKLLKVAVPTIISSMFGTSAASYALAIIQAFTA